MKKLIIVMMFAIKSFATLDGMGYLAFSKDYPIAAMVKVGSYGSYFYISADKINTDYHKSDFGLFMGSTLRDELNGNSCYGFFTPKICGGFITGINYSHVKYADVKSSTMGYNLGLSLDVLLDGFSINITSVPSISSVYDLDVKNRLMFIVSDYYGSGLTIGYEYRYFKAGGFRKARHNLFIGIAFDQIGRD